jgi:hypothetical protein
MDITENEKNTGDAQAHREQGDFISRLKKLEKGSQTGIVRPQK